MSAPRLLPSALLLIAGPSLVGSALAQPPGLEPTATRELAGSSLESMVESIGDGWLAWAAPTDRRRDLCCWTGGWNHGAASRGCSLSAPGGGFGVGDSDPAAAPPAGAPYLVVLLERRAGATTELRVVGESCPLRRDGESLTWLSDVAPQESLAFLEPIVRGAVWDRTQEGALAAAALHDLPRATDLLEEIARSGARRELRGNAIFWLGEARGEAGYRTLDRLLDARLDGELEEKIVFALSVNETPEAHDRLLRLARTAERSETRSQALFWLAQGGAPDVEAVLRDAAEDSAEAGVREQAVFAMSQLPESRAVDALLRVLRETRRPEVRRQALFWLANSDDPRALDEIERLLAE